MTARIPKRNDCTLFFPIHLQEEKSDFVLKAKQIWDAAARVVFVNFFLPFMNKVWSKIGINIYPNGTLDFFKSFVDDALKNRKEVNGQLGHIIIIFIHF